MVVEKYLEGIEKSKFGEILKSEKFVIVDVFAEWCGPCQTMKPIFDELSEKYPKIKFLTIDSDACDWINAEYDVDSIPRFLFFEDSKLIYEQKGASPKSAFEYTILDKMLKVKFEHFHDNSGISKSEFDELVKSNSMAVFFIFKENSQLNDIFKPAFVSYSEEFDSIYFGAIDYDKTSWLKDDLGIKDVAYERYGDPEKKLPYFLFYKDGNLLTETGPAQDFEGIIKGKMLNLFNVEEFEKGISEEDFNKITSENKYVIVDIYTTWCGPCKMMKPIFQDLSATYKQIKFISVDLDQTPWLGAHEDYGTTAIPTFLLIKDNKLVEKKVGGMAKEQFEEKIKEKMLK